MSIPGVSGGTNVGLLRKTLDLSASLASQLLSHVPAPPSANPPHLGNRLDVRA